jgi:hypothetical protein
MGHSFLQPLMITSLEIFQPLRLFQMLLELILVVVALAAVLVLILLMALVLEAVLLVHHSTAFYSVSRVSPACPSFTLLVDWNFNLIRIIMVMVMVMTAVVMVMVMVMIIVMVIVMVIVMEI